VLRADAADAPGLLDGRVHTTHREGHHEHAALPQNEQGDGCVILAQQAVLRVGHQTDKWVMHLLLCRKGSAPREGRCSTYGSAESPAWRPPELAVTLASIEFG
jgi:hypothetical protein